MPSGTRRRVTAAAALSLLMSGCAGGTGAADPATGADVALLGCDDLVPTDELVAAALTGADGVVPSPIPAMPPLEFDPFPTLLPAAGGLRCSWNAGAPAADWTTDLGYLSVEALPDAGDAMRIRNVDGEPIGPSRSVGGYDTIATCQVDECVVAASVEGVWTQVRLQWTAFSTDSRFATLDAEVVLDRLAALAEPAFAAIASAEPASLEWPVVDGDADADADCTGIGTPAPLPEGMSEFSSSIAERAGVVNCDLEPGSVFIVPGAGALVDAMVHEPDFDSALESFEERVGYPAVGRMWAPGSTLVVLTIDGDAYLIGASDAAAQARDIAEARVAGYEPPQRPESPDIADIATAEAEGLALVEATAAELGLTIATTYPPERRTCEHANGFTGVVSDVAVTTEAPSMSDEELFERAGAYWASRGFAVYQPDNGLAAEGAAGDHFSTISLTAPEFGAGPSIRVQLTCALE